MVNKMKTLTSITLLMVIASTLILQPYMAQAVEYPGYLRVSTGANYLTAGKENPFYVMLTNTGTSDVYEVKATLTVSAGTPGISVVSGSHTLIHKILEGKTYTMTPVIHVDENTPLGTYSLQFQLTYNLYSADSRFMNTLTTQLYIIVSGVNEPEVIIDQTVEDTSMTAGIDQTLSYKLKNNGVGDASDLSSIVSSNSPYISIIEGSKTSKTSLDVNESYNHEFNVRISKNAPVGVYYIISNLYYTDNNGVPRSQVTNLAYNVDKISKPKVSVEVSLVNPRLVGGTENMVNVSALNSGEGLVDDVEIRFASNSPYLVVLGNGLTSIGEISPDETGYGDSVFAVSRNAPVGVYTVMATVSYNDVDGIPQVETYTLGVSVESVSVSKQTSLILNGYATSIDPIHPGDRFDLVINLDVLGARAQDVKAVLSVDSAMTGISSMSPSLVYLGDMEPSEGKNASYRLLVGGLVRAGQYPIRVTVSYLDSEGMIRSLSETLTLDIRGIINFRMIDYVSIDVAKGEISEIETDLLLVGTENVDFVSIEVVDDETFDAVVGSYEYIGAVDPDSPIPFDLKFKVDNSVEEGEHNLKLRLLYTDDLNQEYETTLSIPVNVVTDISGDEQADTGGFWGWLRSLFGLGP